MPATSPTVAIKDRLSHAIFGITSEARKDWPGIDAYLSYVESQMKQCGSTRFLPLWRTLQLPVPITLEDQFEVLHRIVLLLHETNKEWTIDGILQMLLVPFGQRLQDLDDMSQRSCRQAVFNALSWLLMLFEASQDDKCEGFKINVPSGVVGVHDNQGIAMSGRPVSRLCRGFGPLLPSRDEIYAAVQDNCPDLLHVSNLNMASLKLISKIRITWTDSLGYHLLFNPLKRTVMVYRFPTFCALNSSKAPETSIFNSVLHDHSLSSDTMSELAALHREIIMSYRVIFGQRSDSRKVFRKVEKKRVTESAAQYDTLLGILCGELLDYTGVCGPDVWMHGMCKEGYVASGPKAGIQDGSVSDYRGIYRGIWTRPSDGGFWIHHPSNTAGPNNANKFEPLLSIPT
ncbi:hypothetical protein QQS21_004871 [Conoideocrella luteorostrata]|uniref:Uncharacterized protein n=1 Tax=Conoideocrella luteorostrata TaxID=1105319 RepID=A0AAJ0CUN9_9HYPO|nr:hypothetical protein QQS21_004871 [Conoideocrella luteorostrata]